MAHKNQDKYFNRKSDGQLYCVAETVDGEFMVLVNGFQWSQIGNYDLSGAGDSVFPTVREARDAYEAS